MQNTRHLLYVAPFFEVPATSGASLRATELARVLAEQFSLVLLTYEPAETQELLTWAESIDIEVFWMSGSPSYGKKSHFLNRVFSRHPPGFSTYPLNSILADMEDLYWQRGSFDITWYSTQLMAQVLTRRSWPSKTVIDAFDVYTPIAGKKILSVPANRPYHWLFRLEAWRMYHYERQIFNRSDLVLVPSRKDVDQLRKMGVHVPLIEVPNGTALPNHFRRSEPEQRNVLMVGSFAHYPNVEGLSWFYERVWPLVLDLASGAHLYIVGSYGEKVNAIVQDDPSVSVFGRVPELAPFYAKASCAIVPVLSGGGTRIKLLEAMAHETPVISTSLGVSGIEHKNTILVKDSVEAFAEAVVLCLRNPEQQHCRTHRALYIVKSKYSWEAIGQQLLTVLAN